MPSSYVSLPCLSHRSCIQHAYLHIVPTTTGTCSRSENTITGSRISAIESERNSTWNDNNSKSLKLAPIQCLPNELLLSVLSHIGPLDKACLALTCRHFAAILGTDVWKAMRTTSIEWSRWIYPYPSFLDRLERDLTEDYWRCKVCECFHRRRKPAPSERRSRDQETNKAPNWKKQGLRQMFLPSNQNSNMGLGFNVWVSGAVIFNLTFPTVEAVMNRHHQKQHGACLDSLRCSGIHTIPFSSSVYMTLKYHFVPKIVLDRLLLKATYTMHQQDSKLELAGDMTKPTFLKKTGLRICAHTDIETVFQNETSCLKLRCRYCPAQYALHRAWNAVTLEVWHNLGSGQSSSDTRWMHATGWVGFKKEYDWQRENIKDAYERILCSTKAEFDRQVERSNGWGNWYDPQLQTRGYKTLPVSLAETL